jgi:hypothetical protein
MDKKCLSPSGPKSPSAPDSSPGPSTSASTLAPVSSNPSSSPAHESAPLCDESGTIPAPEAPHAEPQLDNAQEAMVVTENPPAKNESQFNMMLLIQSADWAALSKHLEDEELDAPNGIPSPEVYGKLLATYLLQNDMCNAKLLWKRFPNTIKNNHPELGAIWAVGQKMWGSDFPGIYTALNREWTGDYKILMEKVAAMIRQTLNR